MKIKMRREAKVGLFSLLTLGALYWGINFLRGQDLFGLNNTYYAMYDQANGLQKSSAVTIKGFKVGVINAIEYDPSKSEKIVVELSIKSKYKIPANSQARVYSDGLLGGKAIEIIAGDSDQYLADKQVIPSSQDKDLLELAGSEIEVIKQKASMLVDNISTTLNSINQVFTDNSENLNATIANLAQISGSLNYVMQKERESMRGLLSNINELSAALQRSSSGIENIVGHVEEFTDSLRRTNITSITESLTQTLGELNTTLDMVNSGKGTLGKLVTDDGLYDSLVTASSNLALLLEDLKNNPERYVTISVFGRTKKK